MFPLQSVTPVYRRDQGGGRRQDGVIEKLPLEIDRAVAAVGGN